MNVKPSGPDNSSKAREVFSHAPCPRSIRDRSASLGQQKESLFFFRPEFVRYTKPKISPSPWLASKKGVRITDKSARWSVCEEPTGTGKKGNRSISPRNGCLEMKSHHHVEGGKDSGLMWGWLPSLACPMGK